MLSSSASRIFAICCARIDLARQRLVAVATTVGRDVRDSLAVGPPRAVAALEFLDGPGLREAALRQTQRSCRSIALSTSASYPHRRFARERCEVHLGGDRGLAAPATI
jgi:hypothetical protein